MGGTLLDFFLDCELMVVFMKECESDRSTYKLIIWVLLHELLSPA